MFQPKMTKMIILLLFHILFVSSAAAIAPPPNQDGCDQTSCKRGQPPVRFPFRLKGRQPDHCGASGFVLSCNNSNQTVLELPTSVKLLVKRIDYIKQRIQVYDEESCIQKQLPNLTISASPFTLIAAPGYEGMDSTLQNNSLFKCLAQHESDYINFGIPCLNQPGFYFKFVNLDFASGGLLNCSKVADAVEVPIGFTRSNIIDNNFHFNWSEPACGSCEAKGNGCRANLTNPLGIECYYIHRDNKGLRKRLVISGIILGSFLLALSVAGLYWLHHLHRKEKEGERRIEEFLENYKALKPSRYFYADIKRITNQFKEKLGQGGYGTVFKGTLSNDVSVAVKVLNNFKGNGEEFINEVGSMGRIHHVNVTRLVGFCADGANRALVYEYLPNESLEKFIFGENRFLSLEKLQDIALGIAKGIEYLHQGCEQRILHFDIKPHNILLDENLNPKISDFGLAKLCSKEQSAVSMTTARGTMGYIAPEVLSRNFGNVSYKSDVYSFGMLLLEMVGGRKNIDVTMASTSQVYFPEWAYSRLENGEEVGINIEGEEHHKIAKKLTIVGLWCIQWYPVDRPSTKAVVQMLEGEVESLIIPPNPFASKDEMKLKKPINRELAAISE